MRAENKGFEKPSIMKQTKTLPKRGGKKKTHAIKEKGVGGFRK